MWRLRRQYLALVDWGKWLMRCWSSKYLQFSRLWRRCKAAGRHCGSSSTLCISSLLPVRQRWQRLPPFSLNLSTEEKNFETGSSITAGDISHSQGFSRNICRLTGCDFLSLCFHYALNYAKPKYHNNKLVMEAPKLWKASQIWLIGFNALMSFYLFIYFKMYSCRQTFHKV